MLPDSARVNIFFTVAEYFVISKAKVAIIPVCSKFHKCIDTGGGGFFMGNMCRDWKVFITFGKSQMLQYCYMG